MFGDSGPEGAKKDGISDEDVWVEPNIVSTDNSRRDPGRMGKGRMEDNDEEEEELLLEGSRRLVGGDGDTDPGMFVLMHGFPIPRNCLFPRNGGGLVWQRIN